jgi:dTDP-glucose pyrophosphorylase
MTDRFTTRILLPAAGFGKRLGQPEAKEMLHLRGEGRPLIDWSLEICKKYEFKPLIISRKDKTHLNEYLEINKDKYHLDICYIDASKEWPDTVLQSKTYWLQKNILMLPDTRFSPIEILSKMSKSLDDFKYSFATFKVQDLTTWGVLRSGHKETSIAEKPKHSLTGDQAWGLFGFQKNYGEILLQKMLHSESEYQIFTNERIFTIPLEYFEDKTRDGLSHFEKI